MVQALPVPLLSGGVKTAQAASAEQHAAGLFQPGCGGAQPEAWSSGTGSPAPLPGLALGGLTEPAGTQLGQPAADLQGAAAARGPGSPAPGAREPEVEPVQPLAALEAGGSQTPPAGTAAPPEEQPSSSASTAVAPAALVVQPSSEVAGGVATGPSPSAAECPAPAHQKPPSPQAHMDR